MATQDDNDTIHCEVLAIQTERLARDGRVIHAACESLDRPVGALEFHDHPRDRLGARLAQADALIAATYGPPGEGWQQLTDGVRDSYLWAVHDLIRAARGDLVCMDAAGRTEPA